MELRWFSGGALVHTEVVEGSFPSTRRVEVNEIGEMMNSRRVGVGEEEEELWELRGPDGALRWSDAAPKYTRWRANFQDGGDAFVFSGANDRGVARMVIKR